MTSAAASPRPNSSSFRFKATGRIWTLDQRNADGPIGLIGQFFGPDNYVRVFVTPEELSEDYEAVLV